MQDLKVGLVGPGAIGRTHAAAVAAVDGLSLVAVVGGAPETVAALETPGIRHFDNTAAMLSQAAPDIVVITTPSGLHYDAAEAALRHGCHVMVEKPLTVDPDEAARLVGLAESTGRIAATVSQRRLERQHVYIDELLRTGKLGKPHLIEADVHWWRTDAYYADRPWRREVAQGGGSLFNQGIHSLDLLLWLFGPIHGVSALAATLGHKIEVEDTTAALLSFESGAIGTLVTSTATPPGHPAELRVFTDKGSFAIAQDKTVHWNFADVPAPPSDSGLASGAANPGAIGIGGHVEQWRDFLAAIRENRPPAITFADGCDAVRVASAIYRAANEGRFVTVAEFPRSIAPEARETGA